MQTTGRPRNESAKEIKAQVRLTPRLLWKMETRAARLGISRDALVRLAIEAWLKGTKR